MRRRPSIEAAGIHPAATTEDRAIGRYLSCHAGAVLTELRGPHPVVRASRLANALIVHPGMCQTPNPGRLPARQNALPFSGSMLMQPPTTPSMSKQMVVRGLEKELRIE